MTCEICNEPITDEDATYESDTGQMFHLVCVEKESAGDEVPEHGTALTGKVRVGDGAVGYDATLTGWWTLEQIRAAFADGYDWEGAKACQVTIWDAAGNSIATMPMEQGTDYGDYPHHVEWS